MLPGLDGLRLGFADTHIGGELRDFAEISIDDIARFVS